MPFQEFSWPFHTLTPVSMLILVTNYSKLWTQHLGVLKASLKMGLMSDILEKFVDVEEEAVVLIVSDEDSISSYNSDNSEDNVDSGDVEQVVVVWVVRMDSYLDINILRVVENLEDVMMDRVLSESDLDIAMR